LKIFNRADFSPAFEIQSICLLHLILRRFLIIQLNQIVHFPRSHLIQQISSCSYIPSIKPSIFVIIEMRYNHIHIPRAVTVTDCLFNCTILFTHLVQILFLYHFTYYRGWTAWFDFLIIQPRWLECVLESIVVTTYFANKPPLFVVLFFYHTHMYVWSLWDLFFSIKDEFIGSLEVHRVCWSKDASVPNYFKIHNLHWIQWAHDKWLFIIVILTNVWAGCLHLPGCVSSDDRTLFQDIILKVYYPGRKVSRGGTAFNFNSYFTSV